METAQSPHEGGMSDFPQSPSEFDADPRIAFSKLDEKFLLETDEGAEFEWDGALRRWIPVVGIVSSPTITIMRRPCLRYVHALEL
jgi:hypothetical protein